MHWYFSSWSLEIWAPSMMYTYTEIIMVAKCSADFFSTVLKHYVLQWLERYLKNICQTWRYSAHSLMALYYYFSFIYVPWLVTISIIYTMAEKPALLLIMSWYKLWKDTVIDRLWNADIKEGSTDRIWSFSNLLCPSNNDFASNFVSLICDVRLVVLKCSNIYGDRKFCTTVHQVS